MTAPKTVQEAKKESQLARLKAKKDAPKKYPEFYASQPLQLVRAEENAQFRAKRETLRSANEALAIAEITGEGLEQAQNDQAVAALVVERARPPRRGAAATAGLSGA